MSSDLDCMERQKYKSYFKGQPKGNPENRRIYNEGRRQTTVFVKNTRQQQIYTFPKYIQTLIILNISNIKLNCGYINCKCLKIAIKKSKNGKKSIRPVLWPAHIYFDIFGKICMYPILMLSLILKLFWAISIPNAPKAPLKW